MHDSKDRYNPDDHARDLQAESPAATLGVAALLLLLLALAVRAVLRWLCGETSNPRDER